MVQVLQAISLMPTAGDQLAGATGVLGFASGIEWMLTVFAVVSLTLSVILFFWVSAGHKRAGQELTQKLIDSAATNAKLRQDMRELKFTNKRLEQIVAEFSEKKEEVPENVTGAVNT